MIARLTDRLSPEQRQVGLQLVRFTLSGGLVTVLGLGVYALIALVLKMSPQLANFIAYLIAAGTGYVAHSRWSFRGHGRRDNVVRTTGRFMLVSLFSLALNSFWVWLLTGPLQLGPEWPMLPMVFVSPLATFALNRWWVFA